MAHGGEPASFILNWVAGGDHAPYFYAQSLGWYKTAGIDLTLLQGKGSSMAAQAAGAGLHPFGLADLTTVMVAIGKGADEVAVMNVYANYPGGFYWLKSSGITSVKDLAGKKVGNPPGDAARALWPALAKANGVDPDAITWVNLSPNAKLAALKAGTVDAMTEFYNFHHVYKRELGDNIGYQAWKDAGVDPYSNSIVVNGDFPAGASRHGRRVRQSDAKGVRRLRCRSSPVRAGAGRGQFRPAARRPAGQLARGRTADER